MALKMPDKIVMRGTAVLVPYANNPRTHSEAQVEQLAHSIREFGFTNPVLIDEHDGIIAGHGRVLAAKLLDMPKVPCIQLPYLTEAQRRAYVIADNKLALNAGWNMDLLALEMTALAELDFDLSVTGFNDDELKPLVFDARELPPPDMAPPSSPAAAREPVPEPAAVRHLAAEGTEDAEAADGPMTMQGPTGRGNPVISYTLIFSDQEQQAQWFQFIRWLKARQPGEVTIATRLMTFLADIDYAGRHEPIGVEAEAA